MDAHAQLTVALAAWRSAMTAGNTDALLAALGSLDAHLRAHRGTLDPQLAHFLERRSYEKAERWLASGGGSCKTMPGYPKS